MDRNRKLLEGLNPAIGTWLEIGALASPVLRAPPCDVVYADHLDTAGLRAKYANDDKVRVEEIAPVGIVWRAGEGLRDAAHGRHFHCAVASHVIEHVPNPVWWLQEIASVLNPGGALRLVVPDRRYCFDFLRRETALPDVMESYLTRRMRPGVREILDFWGHYRAVGAKAAWRGQYPGDQGFNLAEMPAALERCREMLEEDAYHDTHCSVFTPRSFAMLMSQLAELGLLGFGCTQLLPTARGELEFFVHMMRMEDRAQLCASWRWAEWRAGQG